ncbi:MAG: HAMP domain-containing histidine kinase [Actinobacteria bacterium]|nr:HAMP domain-containing histidine kinase [Actinomycetota bacterium]
MSLRTRLLLAVLACVAAGLVAAGSATYLSLRSFLLERVDAQLVDARVPTARVLTDGSSVGLPGGDPGVANLPPGTFGQLQDSSGTVLNAISFTYTGEDQPTPVLPDPLPSPGVGQRRVLFSADSTAGGQAPGFRVLVEPLPALDRVLVVAIPLAETRQTLTTLLTVEVVVSLAVLAVLAAAAWWLIKRDLRPLEDMAVTADAISAGDLSLRVEPAEPRTEVGRLGLSLNTMLGRIEQAFAEQARTEEKLRRFLADASHELRTPLTSIRGYSEMFERAKDDPEDLELAMRRIQDESRRMGAMVEELLVLARLGEGRSPEKLPVDLARVVDDCVNDARAAAPERDIRLERVDSVDVLGDDHQLHQVVANLLGNAVQHTPDDSQIRVTLAASGGLARLSVADDGLGLEPAVAARVFEPFYRADESRARETGGAGLGLAIVAATVEAHGGAVSLDTAPGAGATFTVTLPLLTGD